MVNLAGKSRLLCSAICDVIKMADLLKFCRRVDENPHSESYRLRSHFYKRIQRGTFVAVSFENQSDRLVGSLVTASEEYEEEEEEEEEEYEENENGRFWKSFIGYRDIFACLQDQFTAWVFYI